MNLKLWRRGAQGALVTLALGMALAQAAIAPTNKVSDVRSTRHNLSAAVDGSSTPTGTVPVRTVKASTEDQVCVFCHTPHAAEAISSGSGTTALGAPLWNRALSGATYTKYNSSSMEADAAELASAPGGTSKLCLSCHDGTMGIDKVNALNGASKPTIAMSGNVTKMPAGAATTGFTRDLTTDLSNDHPISFTYNEALASADGDLRVPDGVIVGTRAAHGARPKMPLENGQMQCATCHDPHLNDLTTGNGNAKFLRMNRFQVTQPSGGDFSPAADIICLACHKQSGLSWSLSAHANDQVAKQLYKGDAAKLREFPSSLDTPANANPPVWQVACLNCHDTHTTQGARRLLREGTDKAAAPKASLERTCYQCHSSQAESVVAYTAASANAVPDIKTEFAATIAMPITRTDSNGLEAHDIGGVFSDGFAGAECSKASGKCGKDFVEARAKLGVGDLGARHAECTDCHNPHRVIKGQKGLPGILTSTNTNEKSGTHRHENAAGFIHSNAISGVLRGTFGVEPTYPNNSFQSMPSGFNVKRGDPGSSASTLASEPFVTREYQICLKCHSNYGYTDDNLYPNGATRPLMGGLGLTAQNANGHADFTRYTNQAKEFQAPLSHAVQVGNASLGNDGGTGTTGSNANNHRSWHPVMAPTGRTSRPSGGWLAPWNNTGAIGTQTMMCSDCHGSATGAGTVMPTGNTATNEFGNPWGPHGSSNNFLLKGDYNINSGEGDANTLCFKCHDGPKYSGGGGTGFVTDRGDGHAIHSDRIDYNMKCNFCHVAVPHGWKNRGLLVNLLDVGKEAGLTAGTAVPYVDNKGYSNGPYYRKAYLRIISFPAPGAQWQESNCNGGNKETMKINCEKPI